MSSLGGQNSLGRKSGARSSRASSTIFRKLRKLDRQIGELDRAIRLDIAWLNLWRPTQLKKLSGRREELDQRRKLVRQQRKQHNANTKTY